MMLSDAGWLWNEDWTWLDPKTGKSYEVEKAIKILHIRRKSKVVK